MKFKIEDQYCERRKPTPEEIEEYLNETDFDMRIELAYKYQITNEHLYLEDLEYILDEIDESLHDWSD